MSPHHAKYPPCPGLYSQCVGATIRSKSDPDFEVSVPATTGSYIVHITHRLTKITLLTLMATL